MGSLTADRQRRKSNNNASSGFGVFTVVCESWLQRGHQMRKQNIVGDVMLYVKILFRSQAL